jgi:DNA-binding response OmpR family regulator
MIADAPRGRRVLIVEDESMIAMLLEDMLTDLGHEVVAIIGKVEHAEPLLAEGAFDFAILDVNLNGETTYPLAQQLRARGVPFLFATGYGSAGLPKEWCDTPVLQKPFLAAQLHRVMREALKLSTQDDPAISDP